MVWCRFGRASPPSCVGLFLCDVGGTDEGGCALFLVATSKRRGLKLSVSAVVAGGVKLDLRSISDANWLINEAMSWNCCDVVSRGGSRRVMVPSERGAFLKEVVPGPSMYLRGSKGAVTSYRRGVSFVVGWYVSSSVWLRFGPASPVQVPSEAHIGRPSGWKCLTPLPIYVLLCE